MTRYSVELVLIRSGQTMAGRSSWRSLSLADGLSRNRRLDVERRSRPDRGFGLGRSEIHPAARRELVLPADHAGRDTVDVGNVRVAKTKCIVAAGRLLFGGVGLARRRPHRNRERRCEQQTELEFPRPDRKHDSPETADLRIVGERGRISKHGNDTPLLRDILDAAVDFESRPPAGRVRVLSFGEKGPCYSRTTRQVASSARGVPCQFFFGYRARSDDAHLAPEHVEELGYFIKTCFAEH
jgi:hypothetical protein